MNHRAMKPTIRVVVFFSAVLFVAGAPDSKNELIAFCHAQDFVPKTVVEVDDVNSVVGLVACGLGVSILPHTGTLQAADAVTRPIAASSEWTFAIAAYWRAGGHVPLVTRMLDAARDSARGADSLSL